MIIFLNLHSGTKLSGWLRHWLFGAKAQKKRKLILGIELGQLALANSLSRHRRKLAIPKLMRGLGTSVKKCPNLRNEPNH
jgi:hypothetical protein